MVLTAFKKDGRGDIIVKSPLSEPTCASDLKKGLLAYYPFNANFNDASGNGNHAIPKNGAYLTTDCKGRLYHAAGFDGKDDYLIVPGNRKLNADSLSVCFYVLVNNSRRRNVTISRINFETGESLTFGIHESLPTDNKWNFGMASGLDPCSSTYGYDPSMACYSSGGIAAGRWYSVVATFGKGIQKLYVDGVLHSTKKRSFQYAKKCNNSDLMIGGWWKADIVSIDGKLDEVRLYNRVINECEIAKLAAAVEQISGFKGSVAIR
ncbi:hypothetical protein A4D02_34115 [Niastella koreensis]|uniref:LamG domain protein jellyroll fold domain protein n=3 Tax=Niastella koreensis TaxID=354356 RepID=G8TDB2_NIAKG|nr:hypothetical protein Niako_3022 [Niastella koreensis GR20-10]OQP45209.1 hypothetical protein A4D02_34115 [Niastella koreensis]